MGSGAEGAECDNFAYNCADPNATDAGDQGLCKAQLTSYLGDGACDREGGYNTARCGWDGGDWCVRARATLLNNLHALN